MSEIDNTLSQDQDHTIGFVATAKCGDMRIMADNIVCALGNDRSSEDTPHWDPDWTSDELGKRFELSIVGGPEDGYNYWLEVSGMFESDSSVTYGFESDYHAISLESGDDEEAREFLPIDDKKEWQLLEATLRRYLKSAPGVAFDELPINEEWQNLFQDIMLNLALEDTAVKVYRKRYDADRPEKTKKLGVYVSKRIQHDYALPEELAQEVLGIVEQRKAVEGLYGQA